MGNLPKALEMHQEALRIRRKALGEAHDDVGQSLNNIGSVYSVSAACGSQSNR